MASSRLKHQLEKLAARDKVNENHAAINEQLKDASDALELAARCALGAWTAREGRTPHFDDGNYPGDCGTSPEAAFELGYRLACEELSLILRAMRRGGPPSPQEMKEVEAKLIKEILECH